MVISIDAKEGHLPEPNTHLFEQTPGDSEGQGSQVCCNPWCHRVGHDLATEQQLPFIIKLLNQGQKGASLT